MNLMNYLMNIMVISDQKNSKNMSEIIFAQTLNLIYGESHILSPIF